MKNPNSAPPSPKILGVNALDAPIHAVFRVMCCWLLAGVASLAHAQTSATVNQLDPWQPGQLTMPAIQSDPHNDVRKLLRQAKFTQALGQIDKALLKNPRDPQMRFWQGYVYEQTGNPNMAQQVYLSLTQEYPELPEPHNNLGVLYAAQGDYEKARASLEAALRSNPNYATAHANLGDVLMASAKQAYLRAQQLGDKSTALKQKIESLTPTLQRIENKP